MKIRKFLKKLVAYSPVAVTKNERYDRLTQQIIQKVCHANSICIDVGANEGKILSMFIKNCPGAIHYAFEPIPPLYYLLKRKYASAAHISDIAIAANAGISNFNYVTTDPAYSGLKKRAYDKPEEDTQIVVNTATLDSIIPLSACIKLIKLDIEGGEYHALKGATRILQSSRPYILFEFGKAGAEAYNITPKMLYDLLYGMQYNINLLHLFLKDAPALSLPGFTRCYTTGQEYFFIAYPI
jgi:FkbM family methyltransferase